MNVLEVNGLNKSYPGFALQEVSFSLEKGKITGFIGRNGAGKSTTLKSLFHFVHPDSGSISFFGMDISEHELAVKQQVGFVSSGVNYYPKKKLKKITAITRTFFDNWNDQDYRRYLQLFQLDENKTPEQLSEGMKVKYALALALSHDARLLILDEPTSGLDPVSRDDLLDVFMNLCDEGKTILFSTHITSDLDKCADNIIYIKEGQILSEAGLSEFVDSYRIIEYETDQLSAAECALLIGCKRAKHGMSALLKTENAAELSIPCKHADLESIMIHLEKEDE